MAGKEKTELESKIKYDTQSLSAEYQRQLKTWESLRDEAIFIIEHELDKRNIKYHAIHKRVKTLESALKKAQRRERSDVFSSTDMVGIRIVCLFLSDLEKIGLAINEIFDVTSEDDKINEQEVALFGYMSVHYIVRLKNTYSGPRYDAVKEIFFEIQVRTIAMDAWAATSHYLDYKSEQDVPNNLRKDFYALSGLFYVADQHFEMFFKSRLESQKAIAKELKSPSPKTQLELNLDTLREYLKNRFTDRVISDAHALSQVLQELKEVGYTNIEQIDVLRDQFLAEALEVEKEIYPNSTRILYAVGIMRVLLSLGNERYRTLHESSTSANKEYWATIRRHIPTDKIQKLKTQ
jgi:ppGpp synthetase/RelA/SpoT-type nucleotidyltranferase